MFYVLSKLSVIEEDGASCRVAAVRFVYHGAVCEITGTDHFICDVPSLDGLDPADYVVMGETGSWAVENFATIREWLDLPAEPDDSPLKLIGAIATLQPGVILAMRLHGIVPPGA